MPILVALSLALLLVPTYIAGASAQMLTPMLFVSHVKFYFFDAK